LQTVSGPGRPGQPATASGTADRANRLLLYTLVVVWFQQAGHAWVRFPERPWYRRKQEPSFADLLTTLRRVSHEEKTQRVLPQQGAIKTWITQMTELLSRVG
jgi:hypothetical protein